MGATAFSLVSGFAREVVNARFYGARWEMDTFLAAATIPTILFGLFNGALVSALVPTFSEYFSTGREREGRALANTIVTCLAVILPLASIVGWLLAPWYVPLIAHGFPAPQMGVAVRMTRWLLPSLVATSLSGVFAALLNAHHRFSAAAMQGVAINAVTIITVLTLNGRLGIYALVLGTALGLSAQLAVVLPSVAGVGGYRPQLDLRHPGLRRLWLMLGPIVVGSAAGQLALFFDRFFASTLSPGYMAGMNYAQKLVGVPQQVFAAAIATVIFPLVATHFASQNRGALRGSVTMGLRMVGFITIPSICGLMVLATPLISVLFQRGEFGPTATQLCAGLLPYAAGGLLGTAASIILTRCAFACRETRWPVGISVAVVVLNVVLSLVWLPTLGARGLLLANAVSQAAQAIALGVLVWRLIGGLDAVAIARSAAGALMSAGAMVVALLWIYSVTTLPATFLGRVWYLAGMLAIGAIVFFALAKLLRLEELDLAIELIVRKYQRHVQSPPENREVPIA